MIKYFDTSVMVAALVQGERNHDACPRELISPARKVTSSHALGEFFATLTSGRLPLQFTPEDAEKSIQSNIVNFIRGTDIFRLRLYRGDRDLRQSWRARRSVL